MLAKAAMRTQLFNQGGQESTELITQPPICEGRSGAVLTPLFALAPLVALPQDHITTASVRRSLIPARFPLHLPCGLRHFYLVNGEYIFYLSSVLTTP
jgi:hypothetical protein